MHKRCFRVSWCRAGVLLLLCTAAALAQLKGTISGYVRESSGAVIPGARVLVTNEQTAASREATTNGEGFYQVLALGPGTYTLEAERASFKRFKNSGLALRVDENVPVDIQMEVGALAEYVEVTAQATVVDTRPDPENDMTSGDDFGRILGARAGRAIQLALKVIW